MSGDDLERTRWFLRQILPHEPALRRWLGRRQGAGIDVDDIIQESYAALSERESIEDIRYPRAYLFQIANSLVVRHVRRSRVVSIKAVESLELDGFADEAVTPEQRTVDRDELRQLAKAIAAMPGQTRQAFILRRVHGLPQREIAARMALSENTVEKHIARGIRHLIDWYGAGGNPGPQTSKDGDLEQDTLYGQSRNKS
ncbi:MAG: RNA polymerase sigma factor [Burkholderiales bacterium]|nr:MAG: RNA polymerase sigma factor [Burkholderiales bacterium]